MKKLWWVRLNNQETQPIELIANNSLGDYSIMSIDPSQDELTEEHALKDDKSDKENKSDIEIFFEDLSDL